MQRYRNADAAVKMHHMHFRFDSFRFEWYMWYIYHASEYTLLCAYLFHSIFGMERIAPATRYHFMTPDLFLPHSIAAIFRFRSLDLTLHAPYTRSFSHFFYAHAPCTFCIHTSLRLFSGNSRKAYEISAMHTFSHSIFAFEFLHFHFNRQYHAYVCVCEFVAELYFCCVLFSSFLSFIPSPHKVLALFRSHTRSSHSISVSVALIFV